MTWRERAACTQTDPEVFFPDSSDRAAVRAAKAVCATCPVVDRCGDDAARAEGDAGMGRRWGVWGGATPAERYTDHRGVAHGTAGAWDAGCRCDVCQDEHDDQVVEGIKDAEPALAASGVSS